MVNIISLIFINHILGVVQHVLYLQEKKAAEDEAEKDEKKREEGVEMVLRHYHNSFRIAPSFLSAIGFAIASGAPEGL